MLDAALPASTSPDLVANVRPGEGASSIAIDLGPRFASFRTTDTPGDRGGSRLVIDVMAQTTETQPTTPTPTPAVPETPPLIDLAPSGGLRAIVIDAGHGGDENGAKGPNGTLEKQVTLSVARRLKGGARSAPRRPRHPDPRRRTRPSGSTSARRLPTTTRPICSSACTPTRHREPQPPARKCST